MWPLSLFHRRGAGRRLPCRPGLEVLEDRAVPATFTVTNFNDSGPGVQLATSGTTATISQVKVDNNNIVSPCQVVVSCGGITLNKGATNSTFSNIQITNNTVDSSARFGLFISPTDTEVRVKGNTLLNNSSGNFSLNSTGFITEFSQNTGITKAEIDTLVTAGGAAMNGSNNYCSDCTIANPCAGAGTGAFWKHLNNVKVCN